MSIVELIGWCLLGGYLLAIGTRLGLALRWWTPPPGASCRGQATVLQPIRSGDPSLGEQLAANLVNQPQARFRWLVDADDPTAQRVCRELAAAHHGRVEVQYWAPPPASVNPKVYKLARAISAEDQLIAVLDDDTVLPPGALAAAEAALADGDLVTGVPYYRDRGTLWSRLTAAFVNGNALITYPPLAVLGQTVTINGMFVLTTASALERAGGFAGIEHQICDDYELARAYRHAGLTVVQAAIPHPLSTVVPDAAGYWLLLRRWMVFAQHLLSRERSPLLIGLIGLPTLLPLATLIAAAETGAAWLAAATLVALLVKAVALARLRTRLLGVDQRATAVPLEVLADLLTPLQAISALVFPGRITWRGRRMRLDRTGRITP
jgi:ceramide glucosyltransferase